MNKRIELTAVDGFSFLAYVAEPVGAVKGAVVVLQEIFGVNAHIRAVADSYAAEGYLAIAPAMFHRVKPDVERGYTLLCRITGVALPVRWRLRAVLVALYWRTLAIRMSPLHRKGLRLSGSRILTWMWVYTRPAMGLIAIIVALLMRRLPRWRASAPWYFSLRIEVNFLPL
jgi:Dienelactone hydrolase family